MKDASVTDCGYLLERGVTEITWEREPMSLAVEPAQQRPDAELVGQRREP